MPSVFTQARLQQLRAGDRVTYGGVQWQVMDYSTYADDENYQTAEWLLRSLSGKEHYLLREIDPHNPDSEVNWYFSEEISLNQVSGIKPGDDIRFGLWDAMRDGQPYHQLRALGRVFTFESQTTGNYRSDEGDESRTTWDYWDADRTWNLALEAWAGGLVRVYSTKPVQPEEFSDVERSATNLRAAAFSSGRIGSQKNDRIWQWIGAWTLIIVGLLLMLFGGW
ncbi:DUF4178 domain-containing protein [Pseudanabaena sp. PCC 6802]|uniref:DUF4178 domain-containing protein n=1 Tax=Pseudanabaena sp. PCC 6802 TaxID=118173 RepID=UPI00034A7BCE|nr:DUF4178 domain-containing protein [Pseudanabaena sp. PCC 6802]